MFRRPAPKNLDMENLPWRYIPEMAGGGVFLDMGSHMLDILNYILGPIRTVTGSAGNQAGRYPAEDIVTGSFVFEDGIHGVGTWCFTSFDDCDQTEIVGNRGRITYSCFGETPIVLHTDQGRQEIVIKNPPHIQQPLIQAIVDELVGGDRCVSTGDTGARTSWVMEQMIANFYA